MLVRSRKGAWLSLCPFSLLIAISILLSGCVDVPREAPAGAPSLVTLPPREVEFPPTVTTNPTPSPTAALTVTPPVVIPPTEPPAGPESAVRLWRAEPIVDPQAVDGSSDRLGVLMANGAFAWVNARSGQIGPQRPLWENPTPGATSGCVRVDGSLAVVTFHEHASDPETGLLQSRSQVTVLDGDANPVWSLPTLTGQQFYAADAAAGLVIVGTWGLGEHGLAGYDQFTGEERWRLAPPDEEDAPLTDYRHVVSSGDRVYIHDAGRGILLALDAASGEERWRSTTPADVRRVQPQGADLLVLTGAGVTILDAQTGSVRLRTDVQAAAAIAAENTLIIAPLPTPEQTRPGLLGLRDGVTAWQALQGQLVTALAPLDGLAWVVHTDFDEGAVSLSLVNPTDGAILLTQPVSNEPQIEHQLTAFGSRIFVLGDHLYGFGY